MEASKNATYTKKKIMHGFASAMLLFAFLNSYSVLSGVSVNDYVYDSYDYWTLAGRAFDETGFHITLFPQTIRGCEFPFIILICKKVLSDIWAWRTFVNALLTLFFTVILPNIIGKHAVDTWRYKLGLFSSAGIYVFFFGKMSQYPLSDIPAMVFFCGAIALLKTIFETSEARRKLIGAGAGVLLYLCYNTRTIYLYAVVAALIVFFVQNIRKKKEVLTILAFILAGMVVGAIPQMIVNNHQTGKPSPFVKVDYADNGDLKKQQLVWGLEMDRYESLAITDTGSVELVFVDRVGKELINRERFNSKSISFAEYLKLLAKYPLDVLGIYTRHLVSSLIPVWQDQYIKERITNKTCRVVLAITLLCVFWTAKIQEMNEKKCFLPIWELPIILPSILETIGAPEVRFYLPVYCIIYWKLCNEIKYRELLDWCKNHRGVVITVVILSFFILAIISGVLASEKEVVYLIQG